MAAIDDSSSLVQHDEHCQVCHKQMTLDQKVKGKQIEQRIWGEIYGICWANERIAIEPAIRQ